MDDDGNPIPVAADDGDKQATPETPEQPLPEIAIEADSDDDFTPIEIKEKVRDFFNDPANTVDG